MTEHLLIVSTSRKEDEADMAKAMYLKPRLQKLGILRRFTGTETF